VSSWFWRTVVRATKLTTTSYAVLGLLAVKSWTTYELTQQMQRSLARFWPRAVSKLYDEPRKLTDHGLATGRAEHVGRRERSRYEITDDGRRELADWLAQPSREPVLEAEFLVKAFLAEHGTRQDLLATLQAVQGWAAKQAAQDAHIAQSYLTGSGPFPDRAPQLVLVGAYLADFAQMTGRWASWATDVVEQWPDDARQREPAWQVLQEIAGRVAHGHGARSEDEHPA
jgi:PadR family transcriptional regulator, regulatory protein AphA